MDQLTFVACKRSLTNGHYGKGLFQSQQMKAVTVIASAQRESITINALNNPSDMPGRSDIRTIAKSEPTSS